MKRKKVDGHTQNAFAEGEGTAAEHAIQAAERALVEEGEEGAHAGQHVDQLVQFEFENQKRRNCRAACGS